MLRHSDAVVSAATWRRGALACVIACAVVAWAAPNALADRAATTSANPEELWRAYPLEQTSTTGSGAPVRPPESSGGTGTSSGATDDRAPRSGPSWLAFLITAGVSTVLVLVALGFRRKRATLGARPGVDGAPGSVTPSAEPKAPAVTSTGAEPRTAGKQASERRRATRARPRRTEPVKLPPPLNGAQEEGARGRVAAGAPAGLRARSSPLPLPAPPLWSPREGRAGQARGDVPASPAGAAGDRVAPGGGRADREKARTTGARSGPVCQIRWLPNRGGSCFRAVTTGSDGVEHTLATSPRFDWRGPRPPAQSPEAEAALRQLAKQLRNDGWRPMRAKGTDFNEQRWYARRFRWRPEEPRAEGNSSVAEKRGKP